MKTIENEKGVALLIVLILSVIILAMSAAMIYMTTQGTRFSGMQKTYKTALEANIGGVELLEHLILLRNSGTITTFVASLVAAGTPASITTPDIGPTACTGTDALGFTYAGFITKVRTPTKNEDGTAQWSAGCNSSLTIDPAVITSYDFSFQLGTAPDPVYDVFAKIVNTAEGNAVMANDLYDSGTLQPGDALMPHLGYLYSLEVLAQSALNPRERAKTSVLYEF